MYLNETPTRYESNSKCNEYLLNNSNDYVMSFKAVFVWYYCYTRNECVHKFVLHTLLIHIYSLNLSSIHTKCILLNIFTFILFLLWCESMQQILFKRSIKWCKSQIIRNKMMNAKQTNEWLLCLYECTSIIERIIIYDHNLSSFVILLSDSILAVVSIPLK